MLARIAEPFTNRGQGHVLVWKDLLLADPVEQPRAVQHVEYLLLQTRACRRRQQCALCGRWSYDEADARH